MAGNLVKWWKHKILGGYKQFSVQECTTDSEELMYHQVRAPSSCSAPPDLLLVSDRENNIPLKTPSPSPSPVVNIITTAAATACAAASGSGQKNQHASHPHQQHLQPQHQHQPHPHQQQHSSGAKELFNKNAHNSKMSSGRNGGKFINLQASTGNHHSHQQTEAGQQQQQHQSRHHAKEERIHLEEFTCDVSVEGGKSSQPLQFSFTFYDLDGHHGKITKDDIVGIVYTIYESIGKSVVVPHCGSKTINVRLTVSPEGKSKAASSATAANKLKKMQLEGGKTAGHAASTAAVAAAAAANQGLGHSRRQHRYRPRKLIKSDDEDDDSTSEKDLQLTAMAAAAASATASKSKSHAGKYNNRMKLEQQQQHGAAAAGNCCQSAENNRNLENHMDASAEHNLYANVAPKRSDGHGDECRRCTATTTTTPVSAAPAGTTGAQRTSDMYLKQASTRVKMLRKARKQKYQDHCLETRQRSLSVGSEACWKSRHSKSSPHHLLDALSPTTSAVGGQQHGPAADDTVDGVQLRGGHRPAGPRPTTTTAAVNRSSAECWNTALNRNDLISIIRESMEKNRLCFQLNGKPQASVSPIRQSQQRQRSNTVSKIPTLIANHSSSIISYNNTSHIHNISSSNNNYNINSNHHSHNSNNINNNSSSNNFIPNDTNIHDISSTGYQQHQQQQLQQHQQQQQQQQHQHHHSHHHLQPHIPIYHQQMAINPAVLAAQSGIGHAKMNLCGYDSFLHATICGGGTSHSPPPPPVPPTVSCIAAPHTQQPIAAVQPIMTAIGHNHHQQQLAAKVFAHPTPTTNLIKTSKILRSGTFSQSHGATPASGAAQSSPLYHGYQRLSSGPGAASAAATRHNLAALNSQNPSMEKAQVEHLEKWLHEREQCAGNALKSQKSRKDAKNYDSLLLAKLTERLQDSTLAAAEKQHQQQHEAGQRRKQRPDKAQKRSAVKRSGENAEVTKQLQKAPLSPETSDNSTYATLIPINGDPIECETLLGGQTSDEETSAELPLSPAVAAIATVTAAAAAAVSAPAVDSAEARKTGTAEGRHVQTGDLLHLNDDEETAGEAGPKAEGTGRDSSSCGQSDGSGAAVVATCTANGAHNSSSTSSLIHRYVHEHIHHHYHHFEDKDE